MCCVVLCCVVQRCMLQVGLGFVGGIYDMLRERMFGVEMRAKEEEEERASLTG